MQPSKTGQQRKRKRLETQGKRWQQQQQKQQQQQQLQQQQQHHCTTQSTRTKTTSSDSDNDNNTNKQRHQQLKCQGFQNHPRGTWLGSLPAFIPRPAPLQACSAAPTPTRSDPRQPKQQASSKDPRRDRRRDGRGCERKPQAPTGFVTARGALRPPPWRENRETEARDRERKIVSVDLCCVALLLPVACVILRPSHCGSVALLPYCFAALVVQ